MLSVQPNAAHFALASLEHDYKVSIVTQNVDDLHERAGSSDVIHLHGELLKSRSIVNDLECFEHKHDIRLGDTCPEGHQLRPHVVWFGEAVPMIDKAMEVCANADVLIIIGTSMQVYPAASLMHYVPEGTPTFFIDPKPAMESRGHLTVISETATKGIKKVMRLLST